MNRSVARPSIPVSWGELLDKITILRIKRKRLQTRPARANVEKELGCLLKVAERTIRLPGVSALLAALQCVNEQLWEIEDAIRKCEAEASFGHEFVKLARLVYMRNDLRAAIKRDLNLLLVSELMEEKSYASAISVSVSSPAPPS